MFIGMLCYVFFFFFFKQKTAYEMRISDWSSDVCSSDLPGTGSVNDFHKYRTDLVLQLELLDRQAVGGRAAGVAGLALRQLRRQLGHAAVGRTGGHDEEDRKSVV